MPGTDVESLSAEVERVYGCRAAHREAVSIQDVRAGELVWEGVVHVYDLVGCGPAHLAFAWLDEREGDAPFVRTVLGIPPVVTAIDAVRAIVLQPANDDRQTISSR